ncbi:hypothetical protein MMC11_008403 [Xylographa trunciseda]|nr:hypothetical protein [Xylographa trunciseda]
MADVSVTNEFVAVYTRTILWHLRGEAPPGGPNRDMRNLAKYFWPRQYPTGQEPSASSREVLDMTPLLKRGTTPVPTRLESVYLFNLVFERLEVQDGKVAKATHVPINAQPGRDGAIRGARQPVRSGHASTNPRHDVRQHVREGFAPEGSARGSSQYAQAGCSQPPARGEIAHGGIARGGPVRGESARGVRQPAQSDNNRPSSLGFARGGPNRGSRQTAQAVYGHQTAGTAQGSSQYGNRQVARGGSAHLDRQRPVAQATSQQKSRRQEPPLHTPASGQQAAAPLPRANPFDRVSPPQLGPHWGHGASFAQQ